MPLEIAPHHPRWAVAFAEEASALRTAMPGTILAVHHIGSTAIPGIFAKPVVDILCAVSDLRDVESAAEKLADLGYLAKGEYGIEGRRYFQKKDLAGMRTHHVHMYEIGSHHIERHIALRDYLVAHPYWAKAYSEAKAAILAGSPLSRQDYQDGKAPIVAALEVEAVDWFRRREFR